MNRSKMWFHRKSKFQTLTFTQSVFCVSSILPPPPQPASHPIYSYGTTACTCMPSGTFMGTYCAFNVAGLLACVLLREDQGPVNRLKVSG